MSAFNHERVTPVGKIIRDAYAKALQDKADAARKAQELRRTATTWRPRNRKTRKAAAEAKRKLTKYQEPVIGHMDLGVRFFR